MDQDNANANIMDNTQTPPAQTPAPASATPAPTYTPAPVATTPAVEPPAEPQPAPQPAPASGPSRKILLVEDDDALANVYLTRLQAEGFDVKRVPNGEDALSTTLQFHPDLILLDVMMPKVSGFDVLDILRNTPETTNIKVIMLTALSQDSDKARAEQLGADDYLVKSQVVIADVVDRIKHHLGMS
ncbi:MAG: response regulator [Candidatus Saccharimonadales bacterium]